MQHKEHYLQKNCVEWFKNTYPEYANLYFSVPNGFKRTASQSQWLNDEGMTKGVADTILLIPNKKYHCLLIEFKIKSGRQSPEQKEFQKNATEKGYMYVIVKHTEDFKNVIGNYLSLTK